MTRIVLRWLAAAFFVAAGLNHFLMPAVYAGMLPTWMPWPAGLVALSGGCEVLGGIGILIPAVRLFAGWGLIALLVAVFPANMHAALAGHIPGLGASPALLWARLPFQAVFIAWVGWVAVAKAPASSRSRRDPGAPRTSQPEK
jgi:uncharacterized membrane protein